MFDFLKMLFCKHNYVFRRKIYGNEIIDRNYKRYEYKCSRCNRLIYKDV